MGFGLRFREKVKQVGKKQGGPDSSGFVPTDYSRVKLTYEEAVKFADSLKIIRRRIQEAGHARDKMFRDVESTLIGPLPCIHEIDPVSGEHTTSEAAPEQANDNVHQGTLVRICEEQDKKIEAQVLTPIDKWISEVDLFKGKMKIIENLRLELDGSRRDHVTLENKIAKQEQKNAEVDSRVATHIQSKDASVAGKRLAFEQYEQQLYEELVSLIGETGILHTALDRSIKLEIETYQRVLTPINQTTARLEQLNTYSPTNSPPESLATQSVAGGPAGSVAGSAYGAPASGYGAPASTAAPGSAYGTAPSTGSGGSYGAPAGNTGTTGTGGSYGAPAGTTGTQYHPAPTAPAPVLAEKIAYQE
jgi:hypothetical protein